jgi:hypothetical protein
LTGSGWDEIVAAPRNAIAGVIGMARYPFSTYEGPTCGCTVAASLAVTCSHPAWAEAGRSTVTVSTAMSHPQQEDSRRGRHGPPTTLEYPDASFDLI